MTYKIKKSTRWNGKKIIPFKFKGKQLYFIEENGKRITGHYDNKEKAEKYKQKLETEKTEEYFLGKAPRKHKDYKYFKGEK